MSAVRGSGPVRAVAFVARCAGAAVLAFVLARRLGLDHPVWATVSALIVSQESLGDTHRSLLWRLLATAFGVGVAVVLWLGLAGFTAADAETDRALILCLAVALCAAAVRWQPNLRVGMWTSAIVILTGVPGQSILQTAFARGCEVLLGGAVGAVLHLLADAVVLRRSGNPAYPWIPGKDGKDE